MKIVVDLQACQTAGSRNRGIGRYSMALMQAMARQAGHHDLHIVLNAAFADTIIPIREALHKLVPAENIAAFHLPGAGLAFHGKDSWRRAAAERMRHAFLENLSPNIVHTSSLFEGLGDDAIASIEPNNRRWADAVTLYDLIPLLHEKTYLANPQTRAWYYAKLEALNKAELLLAISEHSRREAIDALSLPEDRVVNISSAVDSIYRPVELSPDAVASLKSRFSLSKPFVMYTGGVDYRKNIGGLIEAFGQLPSDVRKRYQLAIVCKVSDDDRAQLIATARKHGLGENDVVLTGYVSDDEMVALYNLADLFVFPSLHEGFGLPALEAMACGAAVIGSNTSSLPEVIGRADALFDPYDVKSITAKMQTALSEPAFLASLKEHGQQQARLFSWDASAKRALDAFEALHAKRQEKTSVAVALAADSPARPKLAYVSPLPPEKSGIADYSADLLPQLMAHYDIELIVDQKNVSDSRVPAGLPIRSCEWFDRHAQDYDRVLYHFGNSHYHQHMFGLLARHPGVVVLHDFFLGGLINHLDSTGYLTGSYLESLYRSHGYAALIDYLETGAVATSWKYPCNKSIIDDAFGVIVHSDYSMHLAQTWYGADSASSWKLIPLLRTAPDNRDKKVARDALGIADDDFLVCSFGFLGPTKLNDRLLQAWMQSPLAKNQRCHLVFVGSNSASDYGKALEFTIKRSGLGNRIKITGYASPELYRQYLTAADAAIQLRTNSRGETSAAILDCLAYGIPTIANAHGSSADLPEDVLIKLNDHFTDAELCEALSNLWGDKSASQQLSQRAADYVRQAHDPALVGNAYRDAIEHFSSTGRVAVYRKLLRSLAGIQTDVPPSEEERRWTANGIALNQPPVAPRQMLVDITELVKQDAKSGIQRVVRNVLKVLLHTPPTGYRVEPVYFYGGRYVYARQFVLGEIGMRESEAWFSLEDAPAELRSGDIFLGLDLSPVLVPNNRDTLTALRNQGVKLHFVVYDLLPILLPHLFNEGVQPNFLRWLQTVAEEADGLVCISRSVADELLTWLKTSGTKRTLPLEVGYFHLGADIADAALPTSNTPFSQLPEELMHAHPSFLMVGTLEPRKGHANALAAFESLWAQGSEAALVIVGKAGWLVDGLAEKLRNHPEKDKRLFWFESASDDMLLALYQHASALLASSFGEGFGLPLIEAAHHHLPIIASDLPVFREVAGDHAYYFSNESSDSLAAAIRDWLVLYEKGEAPSSKDLPWLTWTQSTHQLLKVVEGQQWYRTFRA